MVTAYKVTGYMSRIKVVLEILHTINERTDTPISSQMQYKKTGTDISFQCYCCMIKCKLISESNDLKTGSV